MTTIYGIELEDGCYDDGPFLLRLFYTDKDVAERTAKLMFEKSLAERYRDRVATFGRDRVEKEIRNPGNLIASFKVVEVALDVQWTGER